ncbi:MAG: hypothetical protein QXK06_00745 [Candidatus Diapherotrites archaeon]
MEYTISIEYSGKKTTECGNAQTKTILKAGDKIIEKAIKESE